MHGRSLAFVVTAGLVLAVGCRDEVGSEPSRPSDEIPAQIELPGEDALEQPRPTDDRDLAVAPPTPSGAHRDAEPLPTLPRIPGAVTRIPDWLAKNAADAPIDLVRFFTAGPLEENAAPLYLDALFEFSTEVADCFAEAERTRRRPIVEQRQQRFNKLFTKWKQNPDSVDRLEVDSLLKQYELGFQKLAEAQRRPRCGFAITIDILGMARHGVAAGAVAQVASVRAWRDAQRGNLDAAVSNVELILRLSRDLRPRGFMIHQLMSLAVDAVLLRRLVTPMLNAQRLSTHHCDSLLAELQKHEQESLDAYAEGVRGEYVYSRFSLHDLQYRTGQFEPKRMLRALREWGVKSDGDSIGAYLAIRASFIGDQVDGSRLDAKLQAMTDADYVREVRLLNESIRTLAELANQSYSRRMQGLRDAKSRRRNSSSPLAELSGSSFGLFAEADTRSTTRLRAAQCLVALKRWQLTHNSLPTDLHSVVKEAGLSEVPIDPFGTGPLKMAVIGGRPVVYSVGSDGRDDKALIDWNSGQQPGDYIFRLAPSR